MTEGSTSGRYLCVKIPGCVWTLAVEATFSTSALMEVYGVVR